MSHYDRDNLFEYVDGGADLFLSYGFQKLVTGTYFREGATDEFVVVDLYHMGSKLNAFGIYATYLSADAPTLPIGAEGFADQFLLAFYKGPCFVHLTLNTPAWAHVKHIAQTIADRIPGDTSPPVELSYLPPEHRVRGTLEYRAEALLGYEFLPRGIEAQYQCDREKVTAFVAFFDEDEAAFDALARYWAYVADGGGKVSEDTGLDRPGFSAEQPGHGRLLVIQHRNFLVGVRRLENIASAHPLVIGILARLPKE